MCCTKLNCNNNVAYLYKYLTKNLYNYTVAKHDTARSIEFFFLLNALNGNFKEINKVVTYINVQIELVITLNYLLSGCYYGAANTEILYTGDDRELFEFVI